MLNQVLGRCLQPPEPRKPAEGPEFTLPDVPKLTFDTPKDIADKALPEALKNLPPPPTPSEPPLVKFIKPVMHLSNSKQMLTWRFENGGLAAIGLTSLVCDLCTRSCT